MCHLKDTNEYVLRYGKYPPVLKGYNDANWIADSEKAKLTRSTSGYIFTLEGAVKILQTNLYSLFHNGIGIYSLGLDLRRSRMASTIFRGYITMA